MTLPKISTPIYDLTLPSNGKKISYRPFLVKEEKILLMAASSVDEEEIKKFILQVVRNCVLDEDFDPNKAATFDIEYILINLRIRSVGEEIKNTYTCNSLVNEKRCGGSFDVPISLAELAVIKDESLKSEIELAPDVIVKMKYPKFSDAKKNSSEMFDYDLIIDSLDTISIKNQLYSPKDQSRQELIDFLESLTKEQFSKLSEFFGKLPRFEIRKEIPCPKCGFKHNIVVDDLASFF